MHRMLSTREFAQALGISESSARRMADTGEIAIHRTQGGHRRIPVAEAIRYVRETRTHISRPDLLGLDSEPMGAPQASNADRLLAALVDGHARQVIGLLQAMYADGVSIADMCDGPISAALRVIGDKWPHDRRAIFIEHRAMVLCARALSSLRLSIREPDESAPDAMGCAPAGDLFLLPSQMIALALHEKGFNETNLGPNTPLDVLADAIEDEQPALAWVSLSAPIGSRSAEREIYRLAKIAQAAGTQLVLGGRHAVDLTLPDDSKTLCRNSLRELVQIAVRILDERA